MSQPEIARLERPGANPRISTLSLVLEATGHTLEARTLPARIGLDETQIEERLSMTPEERLTAFEKSHKALGDLVGQARRVRR
jgi:hypothetical protein